MNTTVAEPLALVELNQTPAALPAVQSTTAVANNVVTPNDLLRIAMESGDRDIDRLERLMAMEERYRESLVREREREAVLSFRRDFAAFRGENIIVPKTKQVDQRARSGGQGPKFKQSEYDVVCQMLSPALSTHGFGFRHDQKFTSRAWTSDGVVTDIPWVIVTCFLEHRAGHTETLVLEGPRDDSGSKNALQEMQSSASYLKRQSLLALTGTATGGEDDENRLRPRGGDGEGDDTPPPSQVENYPEAKFNANFPTWQSLIFSGKKTAEEIIAMVETKAPLTAKQRADIKKSPRPSAQAGATL